MKNRNIIVAALIGGASLATIITLVVKGIKGPQGVKVILNVDKDTSGQMAFSYNVLNNSLEPLMITKYRIDIDSQEGNFHPEDLFVPIRSQAKRSFGFVLPSYYHITPGTHTAKAFLSSNTGALFESDVILFQT